MEAMTDLFALVRDQRLHDEAFAGFLHVLVGRSIVSPKGRTLSSGMTFRDVALWLKKVRWDPESVRELGLDPAKLPLRDRQRYWFAALCQTQLDGAAALRAGDVVADRLRAAGYTVSGASTRRPTAAPGEAESA